MRWLLLLALLSPIMIGAQNANCTSDAIARINGYRLSGASQFRNRGTDGKDPGIDADQLIAAICGTDIPPPPPPPPADQIPPLVSLQAAVDRKNNVMGIATAIDNVGVIRVEFYLDGILKSTDIASPYTVAFKLTGQPGAQHPLFALAYDAAGNVGTSNTIQMIR